MAGRMPPVKVENAKLIWRNFGGKETRFKKEGYRSFHVILDADTALVMQADGWNVKEFSPREDDDGPPNWHLEVEARYNNFPPRIVMIANGRRTTLTEELLVLLDWAEFENVDLMINPSYWKNEGSGKSGIKAFLKTMYATIRVDPLELKYADVPEADGAAAELLRQADLGEDEAPF